MEPAVFLVPVLFALLLVAALYAIAAASVASGISNAIAFAAIVIAARAPTLILKTLTPERSGD